MFLALQNRYDVLERDMNDIISNIDIPPRSETLLLKISHITIGLEEVETGLKKLIEDDLQDTASELIKEAPTASLVIDLYKQSTKDKLVFLKKIKQGKNRWYIFWKEVMDYSFA